MAKTPSIGIDVLWFNKRFDELERQHTMILAKLEGKGNVTPELEAQVRRAQWLAGKIDRKVPDNLNKKEKP